MASSSPEGAGTSRGLPHWAHLPPLHLPPNDIITQKHPPNSAISAFAHTQSLCLEHSFHFTFLVLVLSYSRSENSAHVPPPLDSSVPLTLQRSLGAPVSCTSGHKLRVESTFPYPCIPRTATVQGVSVNI